MALLFYSEDDDPDEWRREITRLMPDLEWRTWPEIGDPDAIDTALVWLPPPGLLAGLANLKAIFSLAAGVDAMLLDPTLPDLPLVRMVDSSLTTTMSEFILMNALKYHRLMDVYTAQQRRREWKLFLPPAPSSRTVGIMGLGVLGADAASTLAAHGFTVKGWSRTGKTIAGVRCLVGTEQLGEFLGDLDLLVCLLPLTADTEGVLNADLFARLKPGCRLLNVGRGRHLVEADMMAELDAGQLAHATLDVVREEPLPQDHPFWRHERIDITPHAASYTRADTGAVGIADNLRRLADGRPLVNVVDRARGY